MNASFAYPQRKTALYTQAGYQDLTVNFERVFPPRGHSVRQIGQYRESGRTASNPVRYKNVRIKRGTDHLHVGAIDFDSFIEPANRRGIPLLHPNIGMALFRLHQAGEFSIPRRYLKDILHEPALIVFREYAFESVESGRFWYALRSDRHAWHEAAVPMAEPSVSKYDWSPADQLSAA